MTDRSTTVRLALFTAAFASCLTAWSASQAWAQSPGDSGGSGSAPPFAAKFWKYLQHGPASYDEWGPFSEKQAGVYPGQSPHGAMLKMYANKTARTNPESLPNKSILIKHNYGPDGKTLMAITVMYKTPGYNPQHGDWYWVKYNPDGSVATTPPDKGAKPIAGRFQSCIDCHSGADGGDYVFAND